MMFDRDILIFVQRGHNRAAQWVKEAETREIALQTYLELLQCARNKLEHRNTKAFLPNCRAVLPPKSLPHLIGDLEGGEARRGR